MTISYVEWKSWNANSLLLMVISFLPGWRIYSYPILLMLKIFSRYCQTKYSKWIITNYRYKFSIVNNFLFLLIECCVVTIVNKRFKFKFHNCCYAMYCYFKRNPLMFRLIKYRDHRCSFQLFGKGDKRRRQNDYIIVSNTCFYLFLIIKRLENSSSNEGICTLITPEFLILVD